MRITWFDINKLEYRWYYTHDHYVGPVIELDDDEQRNTMVAYTRVKYIISVDREKIICLQSNLPYNKDITIRYTFNPSPLYNNLIKLFSSHNKEENMQ